MLQQPGEAVLLVHLPRGVHLLAKEGVVVFRGQPLKKLPATPLYMKLRDLTPLTRRASYCRGARVTPPAVAFRRPHGLFLRRPCLECRMVLPGKLLAHFTPAAPADDVASWHGGWIRVLGYKSVGKFSVSMGLVCGV